MEKVNRYTRAGKYDGKEIYCPKCNAINKVYHFCWSAITCDKCKEMINKTEWNLKKELEEQLMKMPELENQEDELIHTRMNDINTVQVHENELYLRGTDEYGNDFQICFDSYDFLEWFDTERVEYIKEKLNEYIKTK